MADTAEKDIREKGTRGEERISGEEKVEEERISGEAKPAATEGKPQEKPSAENAGNASRKATEQSTADPRLLRRTWWNKPSKKCKSIRSKPTDRTVLSTV